MDFFSLFIAAFGSGYFCFNLLRRGFSQDTSRSHIRGIFDILLAALAIHGLFIWHLALFSLLQLPLPRIWFVADAFVGSLFYPLAYLALKAFLDKESVSKYTCGIHLMAPVLLGIFNLFTHIHVLTIPWATILIRLLYDYMNLLLSPYLIVSVVILFRSARSSETYARDQKKLLSITACALLIILALAIIYSSVNMKLFDTIAFSIVFLFFAVLDIRYISADRFFTEVRRQYKRTRLARFDLRALGIQLTSLFEKEKIFLQDNLTIEAVADHLGLSLHQISEYLNQIVGKNFQQFVNEFRIRHACDLLKSDPARSVLEIGFISGFGTKSSFNAAFRNIMGCSPSVYRAR